MIVRVISLSLGYLRALSLAVDARFGIGVKLSPAELLLRAWLLPTLVTVRLREILAASGECVPTIANF